MTSENSFQTQNSASRAASYLWWQRGIIYEVYPRSFMDSNGDGVGDLKGLISRFDYLRWLGIDAVWLSPIYRSPMKDFGYDVADYTAIHPLFQTIARTDTRGLSNRDHRATTRNAIGTSGTTPHPAADRRTTGCQTLAAAPGSMIRRPSNTTIMPFCGNSPT